MSVFVIGCREGTLRDFSADLAVNRLALIEHLKAHGLRTDGPFTLASGQVADWYLDARRTTFDGTGALLVGRCLLGVLDQRVLAVGGMTIGADPMAVATAMVAGMVGRHLRAFSIRKQSKAHGIGGRLVGPVGSGDQVAVLEDTTTTGGALLEAIEVAADEGLLVVQAVALTDRSSGSVHTRLSQMGIPYQALVTPADLGITP